MTQSTEQIEKLFTEALRDIIARERSRSTIKQLAYTVEQFRREVYPCSRSQAAHLIRTGELSSFKDGARRLILADVARKFVKQRAKRGSGPLPREVSARKAAAGRIGRAAQLAASRSPDEA